MCIDILGWMLILKCFKLENFVMTFSNSLLDKLPLIVQLVLTKKKDMIEVYFYELKSNTRIVNPYTKVEKERRIEKKERITIPSLT